jgi:hypothetical protein
MARIRLIMQRDTAKLLTNYATLIVSIILVGATLLHYRYSLVFAFSMLDSVDNLNRYAAFYYFGGAAALLVVNAAILGVLATIRWSPVVGLVVGGLFGVCSLVVGAVGWLALLIAGTSF